MQTYKQILLQWQDNPRLRLGVLLIVFIVAGNGILMVNDYRNEQLEEYARENKKLIKLRRIQQQSGWADKAQSIRNIRLQLESGLWQAETKGLAQANAQTWLNEKLQQHNLSTLEVVTASVQNDPASPIVWIVPVQIKGTLTDADLIELLNHIEQNPKHMQIDQLQIKRDTKDVLAITLHLQCYFQSAEYKE